ncbi:AraC family transcriptional regulator [Endozoicomonas gorgoniicola]|uniref:AraC family transcriptional regulator n=1 Tax=Endozoicomonas gorgoniicola TaxID=1234144 RepID=A0ABT3MVD3_9GAMM|nr:AraC family transcriptional regulator [Endozoicomonas gorgoniicola]MCW7553330.1 AraC family transcriptional regulator [Endozoicomonas gorgoniicola]
MKAQYEKVPYNQDNSWQLLIRHLDGIPFEWHFHPEYELTLTLNSRGERYIGDTISEYDDFDLVLLGPNIPHSWHSRASLDPDKEQKVYVLWFDKEWIDEVTRLFPECQAFRRLLQDAHRGMHFSKRLAQKLLPLFEELDAATSMQRLTVMLSILDKLSNTPDFQAISVNQMLNRQDSDKRQQRLLNQLLEAIHDKYTEPLSISELASLVGMSESTLGRFFKKMMGQSVNHYITQVRLGKGCSLLVQTDKLVSLIAELSGFNNLSNFNRLFLKYKQLTPKAFRAKFAQTSSEPEKNA